MQKDLCLKRYLSDKSRFADLINGFVADGRQIIDACNLEDRGSQSESTRTQKYRDRLNKAIFGINFMVIGIEGQEKTHYLMPLRCMSYDAAEYERQAVERRSEVRGGEKNTEKANGLSDTDRLTGAEWLSGFRQTDRLRPCVTLVLYFGDEWTGARRLHELLDFTDIPEELRGLVNDYPIHILEVQKLKDTSVFCTDVKQVFDAVRFSKDKSKFRELILSDPAYRNLDIEAYEMIVKYTGAKELEQLRKDCQKGRMINMCEALTMMLKDERDMGLREGISQGINQGISRGKACSVLDILSELSPVPQTLSERIMSEDRVSVLTGWIKLAARVETLEDFEKNMNRMSEN